MKKFLILFSATACLSFADSYNVKERNDTQRDDAYSRMYGQNNTQQNQNNSQKDQKAQDQQNQLSANYDVPRYNPRSQNVRDPFGNFNQKTYRIRKPSSAEISYYQKNQYNVPYGGGTSYYENTPNQMNYQNNSQAPAQQNPYQSPSGGVYSDSIPQQTPATNYQNQLYYQDNSKAPYPYQSPSMAPQQSPGVNYQNQLYYQDNSKAPQNPYISYSEGDYNRSMPQQNPVVNYENQSYYQDNSRAPYYSNVPQNYSQPYYQAYDSGDCSGYYYDQNTNTYSTGMYSVPSEGYRTQPGNHPPHGPYGPASAFNPEGGLNTPIPDDASRYNPGLGR